MKHILFLVVFLFATSVVSADDIQKGDSCLAAYNISEALGYYKDALKAKPTTAVRMKIAECLFRQRNYARCISALASTATDSLDHDSMRRLFIVTKNCNITARPLLLERKLSGAGLWTVRS